MFDLEINEVAEKEGEFQIKSGGRELVSNFKARQIQKVKIEDDGLKKVMEMKVSSKLQNFRELLLDKLKAS